MRPALSAAGRSTTLLVWAASIAAFLLAYLAPVSYEDSDPYLSLVVSHAILNSRTVQLDRYTGALSPEVLSSWRVIEWNGHTYYYFPPGPSVLSIPVVWVAGWSGFDWRDPEANYRLQNLLSALLSALALWAAHFLCRQFLPPVTGLILAAGMILGTSVISTLGLALWNIDFSLLFLFLVLGLLAQDWRHREPGRRPRSLGAKRYQAVKPYLLGALLFGAYSCRPTSAVFIALILAFLALRRRPLFWPTALTALGLLVGFMAWSWQEYGTWLPPYYLPARLGVANRLPVLTVLYGLLLSPSRGLFIFNPVYALILLLTAWQLPRLWRQPFMWLSLGWIGGLILVVSRFSHWWGGGSYGPRLLAETAPAFTLLAALLGQILLSNGRRDDFLQAARLVSLGAFGCLALAGFMLHAGVGLFNYQTLAWGGYGMPPVLENAPDYLFDWRFPQFLSTITSNCAKNRDYLQRVQREGSLQLQPYSLGSVIDFTLADHHVFTRLGMIARPVAIRRLQPAQPHTTPDQAADPQAPAIFYGWAYPKNQQVDSLCPHPAIELGPVAHPAGPSSWALHLSASSATRQTAEVWVNDVWIGHLVLQETAGSYEFELPAAALQPAGSNWIRLESAAASPGKGSAFAPHGLSFRSLSITPSLPGDSGLSK